MEIETFLHKESQDRYLTYALSVVSERALPDVRDGLKPVQRRILYAMSENLGLVPTKAPRKCAAVVGEVLARYHPHGDSACYDALVRMAQSFSLRMPLIEGQGNFGSLDGDAAAAYRYTEARLRPFALEVLGEIREETVPFRDNFDGTVKEPQVLPSRAPNLLVNGASGIAVGMATNIPPHNLRDVCSALLALAQDPDISTSKLTALIKGPDFPTGCLVLNSKKELEEIYRSGRGNIKMRGEWGIETEKKGKSFAIITSIPYGLNKSQLIEKIADLIIQRKVPQFTDIRDESTEDVRIVLELAPGAVAETAMAYLFKNTPLESSFAVNLTALVPTEGQSLRPTLLSLRECLRYFLDFRLDVTRKKLEFEKRNLEIRLHILDGLVLIFKGLDEALEIVRKSTGRADAASKLGARFKLTEAQSLAVVDMRIYQLSRANIADIKSEHAAKSARVKEIQVILKHPEVLLGKVTSEIQEVKNQFGQNRVCRIDSSIEDVELKAEDFLVSEDVTVLITQDGWVKRVKQTNDLNSTRVREGDKINWAIPCSTLDYLVLFTNQGTLYSLRGIDVPASSGFGTPIQKLLKFKDGEEIVSATVYREEGNEDGILSSKSNLFFVTSSGLGNGFAMDGAVPTKRNGRKFGKLKDGDAVVVVVPLDPEVFIVTQMGFGSRLKQEEIPLREGPSQGVQLIAPNVKKGDVVVSACSWARGGSVSLTLESGRKKELVKSDAPLTKRGLRGTKLIGSGLVIKVESGGE